MKMLFSIALLAALGTASAENGAGPASSSRSSVQFAGILGASIQRNGCVAVVAAQPSEGESRKQFLFVELPHGGSASRIALIGEDSARQLGHKVVLLRGQFGFGWIDAGRGLVVASLQDGDVRMETLLADDPKEGAMGDFWIVTAGGRQTLFVARYRHVGPDGRPHDAGRQYTWLYSYGLRKEGVALLGKACVEDQRLECAKMACAVSGDDIVVWQTVREKGGCVATIRCAVWNDEGGVEWRDRYTGNEPLGLVVDTSSGATCLAQEWKSPEDASGILCCVRLGAATAIPVGTYGENNRQKFVRFMRLPDAKLWVLASKDAKGVGVTFLDDDLVPRASGRVDGADISDYALAVGRDGTYVILLQHGSLLCRKVGRDTREANSHGSGTTRPAADKRQSE